MTDHGREYEYVDSHKVPRNDCFVGASRRERVQSARTALDPQETFVFKSGMRNVQEVFRD